LHYPKEVPDGLLFGFFYTGSRIAVRMHVNESINNLPKAHHEPPQA